MSKMEYYFLITASKGKVAVSRYFPLNKIGAEHREV